MSIFFRQSVIFIIIAWNSPILFTIELYGSIFNATADFEAQYTRRKKQNVRPDVTQITIAQKLDQIF